ncbi:hypothetical protein GMMP13_1650015 [Candidatus Magnetomoraceae bacterium gMMP-13]
MKKGSHGSNYLSTKTRIETGSGVMDALLVHPGSNYLSTKTRIETSNLKRDR